MTPPRYTKYVLVNYLIFYIFQALDTTDSVHILGHKVKGAKRIVYKYVQKPTAARTEPSVQPETKVTVYTYFDQPEARTFVSDIYPSNNKTYQ